MNRECSTQARASAASTVLALALMRRSAWQVLTRYVTSCSRAAVTNFFTNACLRAFVPWPCGDADANSESPLQGQVAVP